MTPNNQHDELDRIINSLTDGSVTRLKKEWHYDHSIRQALEMMAADEIKSKAKAQLTAYINREIDKARIDELEKSKRLIGDLHMERIGVPDIDSQTQIREEERRFWHSTLESRLIELNKGYDVK